MHAILMLLMIMALTVRLNFRFHVAGWKKLSCYNRLSRWGVRRKPKTELLKELKLQKCSEAGFHEKSAAPNKELSKDNVNRANELSYDKLVDEFEISLSNNMPCHDGNNAAPALILLVKRKLLQFDKSCRPAYYGTWSKKRLTSLPDILTCCVFALDHVSRVCLALLKLC